MAAVETTPVVVEIPARLTCVVQPGGCNRSFLSETRCDPAVTTLLIYKDSSVKESTILKLSEMGID